jgi:hypothetical protein
MRDPLILDVRFIIGFGHAADKPVSALPDTPRPEDRPAAPPDIAVLICFISAGPVGYFLAEAEPHSLNKAFFVRII